MALVKHLRGHAYDPDYGHPVHVPTPRPRMTAGEAALVALTIIVAWLAIVGLCTVVMWALA